MGDPFMLKLLAGTLKACPRAEALAPSLRDFWADIADGDACLIPRRYFEQFGAITADGKPAP